jgi:transcriptional regulator with XRE-family HTH domain
MTSNEKSKLDEVRFRVWKLRKQGQTQESIAEQLQISQAGVSAICGWLDDMRAVMMQIEAEEQRSGNPSIDGLERQAEQLERAQLRMRPGSKEYLKHSEQIGWSRLKAATLRQGLPADAQATSFEYECHVGLMPQYSVEPAIECDDALRQDFIRAGRVFALTCGKCGADVHVSLKLNNEAREAAA